MPRRLLVPQDDLTLPGLAKLGNVIVIIDSYQLYAVERWIVDRTALLRLLVVYTGDPAHSVHLHVYESRSEEDWFSALGLLAAHSAAKPKQTTEGVLILTSLARFRSDHTIVLLPDGLFSRPVKDRLYTNINLLRLGSSGRTALTLSEPSETTKERFLSTYHTKPALVLALVSLIQSALAIFGYPLDTDGLLCDATVHAISHWVHLFGSPSDRTVDPSFIALLLSLVLSTRNKLAHLGYSHLLPSDPFAHPASLSPALAAYSQSQSSFIPLTKDLIHSISASFDSKRLSRVIRTRLNSDTLPTASTTDTLLSPIPALPSFISTISSSLLSSPLSLSTIWSSPDPPPTTKRYRTHKQRQFPRGGVASDGDNARTKKYDGRSTEEESDPVHRFRGSLGNSFHWPPRKVKLRSWAGLTKRKHQSVDLTPRSDLPPLPLISLPNSPQRERFRDRDRPLPALPHVSNQSQIPSSTQSLSVNTNFGNQRPSPSRRSTLGSNLAVPTGSGTTPFASASIFSFSDAGRAQSPTLPALQPAFFGDGDDEDLLSSGQVSPLSDGQTRPNPFYFSLGGSQAQLHTTTAQQSNPYHPIHPSSFSANTSTSKKATYAGLSARTATPVTQNQNLNIDEKMLARLLLDKGRKGKGKRDGDDTSGSGGGSGSGIVGGRIASWAGPVSVSVGGWANNGEDEDEDEEDEEDGSVISEVGKVGLLSKGISASAGLVPPKDWGKQGKEKARFDNLVRVVDREGRLVEEEMDSEDDDDDESGEESGNEYGRRQRRGEEVEEGEDWDEDSELDEEEEERRDAGRRRAARCVAKGELKRRRSFHDLDTFRELEVLSPERMKIDVELCGQCLIMWRRERHLRNVVDCVRLLASTLSKSNSLLQTDYQSRLPTLTALTSLSASATPNYASVYPSTTNIAVPSSNPSTATSRSSSPKPLKRSPFPSPPPGFSSSPPLFSHTPLPAQKQTPAHLLQSIDEASQQTERFSQATNTLLYQSEQFDVRGLWNWVGRERRKVWALRGGVFGEGNGGGGNSNNKGESNVNGSETGDNGGREGGQGQGPGRKLPEGVHGAHGSFNRLQWRLDGQGVLVDVLGRTESEAEEEERVERGGSDVDGGVGARTVGVEAGTSPKQGQVARDREVDEGQRETRQPEPESRDEEIELEFLDRHLGIKPMWLLKFFTRWGARWSAATANTTFGTSDAAAATGASTNETTDAAGQSAEAGLGDVSGDLNPSEDTNLGTLSTNGGGGKEERMEEDPFS